MTKIPPRPFPNLPRVVENDFMLSFYAAVFCLLDYLRTLESGDQEVLKETLERYPFLQSYLDEMWTYLPDELTWDEGTQWWEQAIEHWELGRRSYLPLAALSVDAEIGFARRVGLISCCMIEEDARFSTLFRNLNGIPDGPRPSLELVGRLILHINPTLAPSPYDACAPLIERGICVPEDPREAHSQWQLRVPEFIWRSLRRQMPKEPAPGIAYQPRMQVISIKRLVFSPTFMSELLHLPRVVRERAAKALTVRGTPGSDRLRVVESVARALRRDTLRIAEGTELGPELRRQLATLCLIIRAIPVFRFELGPGESRTVPELPGYSGPVGIILGEDGGLDASMAGEVVGVSLPFPGPEERRRHWQDAFGRNQVQDLEHISRTYLMPAGFIRQAAGSALVHASMAHRETVLPEDIRRARRSMNRQLLDNLADVMKPAGGWELVVTSGPTDDKLSELERRCQLRETLGKHLGEAFGEGFSRGVRALFNGPSGTGKTLAARALAHQLGMDLYRVDLASVVNKYIGETEKNLNRVLSRAEQLDVILLLDEGDALMGKRTDVQSANDRYANLETNYLLQRIESHQGIILITTNAGEYIDKAFERRMDVAVNFTEPDGAMRERIWQLHLPSDHEVPTGWLSDLSRRATLTGGQIRNAAVLATLLAVEDGTAVACRHLNRAIESEFRKAGAVSPVRIVEQPPGRVSCSGADAFFNLL